MKEVTDKIRRRSIPITVLGITVLALLTIVSIVATSNTVAAAETGFKDYIPQYNCAGINIENAVGSDIVVSWAKADSKKADSKKADSKKADSKKAVFQMNIPKGQTLRVTVPSGSYDQYIHKEGSWYKVITGRIFVECGYEYTMRYYQITKYANNTIKYDGTGLKKIPDSEAPKI